MSKVWLITDGSSGFGRMLAEAALAEGHCVVVGTRQPHLIESLRARHHERLLPVLLDLASEASIYGAVNDTLQRFGRLDVLVSHAGCGEPASIESMRDADLRAHMERHFFGAVAITQAALPILREQGAGHFIQLAPLGIERGAPGFAACHAAKLGLQGYYEVLASEVTSYGLRVTIIEPGTWHLDARHLIEAATGVVLESSPANSLPRRAKRSGLGDEFPCGERDGESGGRVLPFPRRPVAA